MDRRAFMEFVGLRPPLPDYVHALLDSLEGGTAMEITDHKINGLNDALTIVADERNPEHGNMSHVYKIEVAHGVSGERLLLPDVRFQDGPIGEVGVNGISNEALLAIVMDRLRGAQAGKWACAENAVALDYIGNGLRALHERTSALVARGVEGTSAV